MTSTVLSVAHPVLNLRSQALQALRPIKMFYTYWICAIWICAISPCAIRESKWYKPQTLYDIKMLFYLHKNSWSPMNEDNRAPYPVCPNFSNSQTVSIKDILVDANLKFNEKTEFESPLTLNHKLVDVSLHADK
jgi:hypothetical protein